MTDSRERQTSDPLALPDARLKSLEQQSAVSDLKQSLKALPDITPDPAVWERIQARTAKTSTRRGGFSDRAVPFAMAAGLILAVAAGILSVNVLRDGNFQSELNAREVASLPRSEDALRALRERSRQLEPIAQQVGPGSDPVASAFRYRIADVDSQLSGMPEGRLNHAEAQRLWGQRVELLESLAEVRRARAALQPAVY